MNDVFELRKLLWQNGYCPVAVKSGQKAPEGLDWTKRARMTPPEAAVKQPHRQSLSTGILCDDVLGFDIDVADHALADAIEAVIFELIGAGPVRVRDGTGKRLIAYACSNQMKKRFVRGKLGAVEVLAYGQQWLAYGTHPDGTEYRWRDGQDLVRIPRSDLLTISEEAIGFVLDECAALIEGPSERERNEAKARPPATSVVPFTPADTPSTGRFKRYAETTLERVANDLASMTQGSRNDALNSASMRLSGMAAHGWIDEPICRARLLDDACQANGLAKEDGYTACEATFRSGWRAGLSRPAQIPEDSHIDDEYPGIIIALKVKTHGVTDAGDVYDEETGEILTLSPRPLLSIFDKLTLVRPLDTWLEPDGLLKRIAEWIMATSRRPNKPLAVSAAVSILSGICGRHLYGPTGSALNLYIVALAPTAVGKGRPLSAIGELLVAADLHKLHTTLKAFSISALEQTIVERPCVVATVDEIGANLLSRMSHKKASTHEAPMRAALLELWSRERGQAPFSTHSRANAASVEIHSPSFTIYGASTPEAFYESLTAGSVKDGFLNRFLLVEAHPRTKSISVDSDLRAPPKDIVAELRMIVPANESTGNMASNVDVFASGAQPKGDVVRWETPELGQRADDLEEEILGIMDALPADQRALCGRVFEMSVRLAALHAVSRQGRLARVTENDLSWGLSWACQSASAMIEGAQAHMFENEHQAAYKRVLAIISENPMIGRNELVRKIDGKIDGRTLEGILKSLVESEAVLMLQMNSGSKGGRPKTVFNLASK